MINTAWTEHNWRGRFFTLWGGQAISLFGSQLVQFALIWWLTAETGSATVLATATLAGFLPQVVLGPLAGTLVDRFKRRWTMVVADTGIALATLFLAFLFATGRAGLVWIYALLFVRSLGGAFHFPAMTAATSLMVPKSQLTRVQGFNQMLQGALGIISAPLGALAVELLQTQSILAIDVATALFAIGPLLVISIPEPGGQGDAGAETARTSFWADFRAGFSYIVGWPGLLILTLGAVLLNFLLTPTTALEPLLITQHYLGGAIELGWLQAAFGGGLLAGGLLLGVWGGFKKRILTSLTGVIGLGLGFSALGVLPSAAFPGAVAAAFVAGFMVPLANGPIHAILQAAVDPRMQGRVFTLVVSMATGMAPLGLLLAGPFADAFSVRTWYIVAGVACILTGAAGFLIPALLTIEENRREHPSGEIDAPESPVSEAVD